MRSRDRKQRKASGLKATGATRRYSSLSEQGRGGVVCSSTEHPIHVVVKAVKAVHDMDIAARRPCACAAQPQLNLHKDTHTLLLKADRVLARPRGRTLTNRFHPVYDNP